jgi:hypothetical protein
MIAGMFRLHMDIGFVAGFMAGYVAHAIWSHRPKG